MPKFSLITCIYNSEDYLFDFFSSIDKLNSLDYELILVDDYSSDNSKQLIIDYAAKNNKVKYFFNDSNRGLSISRNFAITISKGEYITFIDSDDFINSSYLDFKPLTLPQINTVFVVSFIGFDNTKKTFYPLDYMNPSLHSGSFHKTSPMACGKFYNRKLLIDNNIFFLENVKFEDEDFNFRLACKTGCNFNYISNSIYFYRLGVTSSITSNANKNREDMIKISKSMSSVITKEIPEHLYDFFLMKMNQWVYYIYVIPEEKTEYYFNSFRYLIFDLSEKKPFKIEKYHNLNLLKNNSFDGFETVKFIDIKLQNPNKKSYKHLLINLRLKIIAKIKTLQFKLVKV